MNIMALATRLEDANVGKKAKTIFLHMMPAECKLGVLIRPPLTGVPIDWELRDYYKTDFQLIARSHDYEDGFNKMNAAVEALTIHMDTQVGDMFVRYLRPCHKPVAFPLSDGNFVEFSVRMEICYNGGA